MSSPLQFGSDEVLQDPYQNAWGPYDSEDWFRHQNAAVMGRNECIVCGGFRFPWPDDLSWKYASAGGCLEGPFCSEDCYWTWFHGGGR